jgi:putative hydrolase of HD superfamily
MATPSRIDAQLAFLNEADRLKDQLRATPILSNTRPENSAEHSWHIMLYALTLAEHANRPIQIDRVLKMLLLHDIVEIDAGDAPIHGDHDPAEQEAKEIAAAERIFGLLPADQRDEFRNLWQEFEAAESNDAIFAKSIDRVQPVISNLETGGGSWIDYDVTAAQLETRVGVKVRRGAPAVWDALKTRIDAWFAKHR